MVVKAVQLKRHITRVLEIRRRPTPVPTADSSKILVYDLETTGLQAGSDEILQLAIVDGNGNELINTYIKPQHKRKWDMAVNNNYPFYIDGNVIDPNQINRYDYDAKYDDEALKEKNNDTNTSMF